MRDIVKIKESAVISADENIDFQTHTGADGAFFFLDLSAVAGTTPIFDAKLQYKDPVSGQFKDTGAQFGQQTAAARGMYLIFDDVSVERLGDGTNRLYNLPLSSQMRLVVDVDRTTGDETYTYSFTAEYFGQQA